MTFWIMLNQKTAARSGPCANGTSLSLTYDVCKMFYYMYTNLYMLYTHDVGTYTHMYYTT